MKFLGVHLDNELSWSIHLIQVIDKIQMNKRMLSLGRNLFNTSCMKNIYYRHIHSHLIYAITVWGSMATQAQLNELKKLQKQCIQITNKTSPNSDVTGQFEKLRILRLDEEITLNLCKLGHKITQGNLPKPIAQIFNLSGGKNPTQNRAMPNIQKQDSLLFNKSFQCKSLTEYSKLPIHLQLEWHQAKFIINCKHHITRGFQA